MQDNNTPNLWEHCENTLHGCNACSEHHSGLEMDDIKEVVSAFEGCYCAWAGNESCCSFCDHEGVAVVVLKKPQPDGNTVAFLWECEDTSGHG